MVMVKCTGASGYHLICSGLLLKMAPGLATLRPIAESDER